MVLGGRGSGWVMVLLVGLVCPEAFARGAGGQRAAGRISLGARFSDRVQEFPADVMISLWHPGDSILFANVRGSLLEDREQEVSGGLVLRHYLRDYGVIFGANSYYDHRWTEMNNQFSQVGAGIEILSKWVDVRANYYYPLTDAKVLGEKHLLETCLPCGREPRVIHYQDFEEALQGYDGEIGLWLPYVSRWMPTALYAGYYHFASDYRGNLHGARLRTEIRVHPNLTLDAEWYEDRELNGVDHFVGIRVHIPLDFWNGWIFDRGRTPGDRMHARMLDMVNRDFRIRTVQTGFVPVGASESSATRLQRPSAVEPPLLDEEEAPPTCYLDSEGEVICD